MERDGIEPLMSILKNIGGWPVLLGEDWNESKFDWKKTVNQINDQKFPLFFPIGISVALDEKNFTRVLPKVRK